MTSDNLIGKWFIKTYFGEEIIIGKIIGMCPNSSTKYPFYKCEIYKDNVYNDENRCVNLIIHNNEKYIKMYNSYTELIADVI